jgi:hypothetical protein
MPLAPCFFIVRAARDGRLRLALFHEKRHATGPASDPTHICPLRTAGCSGPGAAQGRRRDRGGTPPSLPRHPYNPDATPARPLRSGRRDRGAAPPAGAAAAGGGARPNRGRCGAPGARPPPLPPVLTGHVSSVLPYKSDETCPRRAPRSGPRRGWMCMGGWGGGKQPHVSGYYHRGAVGMILNAEGSMLRFPLFERSIPPAAPLTRMRHSLLPLTLRRTSDPSSGETILVNP